MIFECEQVEVRADDGTREAIGLRWTEARTAIEGSFDAVAAGCYYTGVFMVFVSLPFAVFASAGFLFLTAMGAMLFIVAIDLLRSGYSVDGRPRELTFWRDGLCYAPEGLSPLRRSTDRLSRRHTEINSIEAEPLKKPKPDQDWPGYTHGVRIVYKTGAIVHIASRLEPDAAHELGVKLSLALSELRASLAREAMGSGGHGSSRERKTRIIE